MADGLQHAVDVVGHELRRRVLLRLVDRTAPEAAWIVRHHGVVVSVCDMVIVLPSVRPHVYGRGRTWGATDQSLA